MFSISLSLVLVLLSLFGCCCFRTLRRRSRGSLRCAPSRFWKIPSESASSMAACSGGACASRGRARRRRVGRRSPPGEHSDGAAASELAPEERRSRHLVATSLPEPELQFPPRHPVRRGLEVPAAVDCFRALRPLWLQWLWWRQRHKGDRECSGAVRCNSAITF